MLCPNECKRLQFQTLVELIINECTEKKNHNAPIYAPISISQHSRKLNKRWTQEKLKFDCVIFSAVKDIGI